MNELRFDGQVAIVTGSGRNLGRAYALLLASRGAKVIVNDLGVGISDTDGVAAAPRVNPAYSVVEEIRRAGGEAEVSLHSISDPDGGRAIVQTAIDAYGTVDILVNNAGVVRQGPIEDMQDSWCHDLVDTQILGTVNVTRPAWRVMKENGYGRVVNVSSGAAFGIPGMSLYGAAKLAVVGLTRALSLEGVPHGIRVNVVAPYASVRGNGFGRYKASPELADWLSPEQVAPLVAWLAHTDCPCSGEWFTAGGGHVGRATIAVSDGWMEHSHTTEDLAAHWNDVMGRPVDFRLEAPGAFTAARRMFEGFVPPVAQTPGQIRNVSAPAHPADAD
jgi:NAD(P)-dependent dehydrogenase (short-subunit alcohol dehydrogenase family)